MSGNPQRARFLWKKLRLLWFLLGRTRRQGWGQFRTGLRRRDIAYQAMEFAALLPSEAGVVVDVGGHHGDSAAAFDFLYGPSRLIVVEPNPALSEGLRRRFAGHPRIEVVVAALAERAGEVPFHTYAFDAASSMYVCRPGHLAQLGFSEEHAAIQVTAITLGELLAARGLARVDLLKLDCQGAELEILRGAGERLHDIRAIYTEVAFEPVYENAPLFGDVHAFLLRHEFDLFQLGEFAGRPGHIQWGDALYVNRRLSSC